MDKPITREQLDRFLREPDEQEKKCLEDAAVRRSIMGSSDQIMALAQDDSSAVLVDDYFLQPHENIGIQRHERFFPSFSHKHNYIEMNFVWSGQLHQKIMGEEILCREGDVCILDMQASHTIGYTGENDIILNILMRKSYFVSAFFNRMTSQGIVSRFLMDAVTKSHKAKHYLWFESGRNPRVKEIIAEILLEYYNKDLGSGEIIDSYMVILFTELLRTWRTQTGAEPESTGRKADILEILDYIEKHYEACSLKDTAERFGFHEKYLTTLLREKTGKSFLEHVQEQKLAKARTLLEMTDLSIVEIAESCGYQNVNFFYQMFKRSENCTPAQYRKNLTFGQ